MPLILCIISLGREKGKTSLVEQLVKRFTEEGLKVATIKHIHSSFDTPEKDTWRHLEAGAALTVAATPRELITIQRSPNPTLEEALKTVYTDTHLILAEGYKESPAPKILCTDTAANAEKALKETSNIITVSGPIADNPEEVRKLKTKQPQIEVYNTEELATALKEKMAAEVLKKLPGLNCGNCGYTSCLELSKAILNGQASLDNCETLATHTVTLKINGREVALSKFPREILRGTILGMLGSLKDVEKNPQDIEIKIRE